MGWIPHLKRDTVFYDTEPVSKKTDQVITLKFWIAKDIINKGKI